jgi:hypothetical protein
MAVRNHHDRKATSVDHPLGSRARSDAADCSASTRADDNEVGVLLVDDPLQFARDVRGRGAVDDTRADLGDAALMSELIMKARELG